jgi:glycine betaine/choline ABC-type transport system substrate-binding protein
MIAAGTIVAVDAGGPAASVSYVDVTKRYPGQAEPAIRPLSQQGLMLPVMQELNARVDIDKQEPAAVATQYLNEEGYIQ